MKRRLLAIATVLAGGVALAACAGSPHGHVKVRAHYKYDGHYDTYDKHHRDRYHRRHRYKRRH